MEEKVLQYIWQYQLLTTPDLYSNSGEKITVLNPGQLNEGKGPDFLEAKIKIGNKIYQGAIEVDYTSRHWYHHEHHRNKNYNNVILHVIWENPQTISTQQGNQLPSLALQNYVSHKLLSHYERLMTSQTWIPCADHIPHISTQKWNTMIEKSLTQRLQRKQKNIYDLFKVNDEDSEATAYQLLASSLGSKLNSDTLRHLLAFTPTTVISQRRQKLDQLEAILLGQAGLLVTPPNEKLKTPYEQEILHLYQRLYKQHRLPRLRFYHRWKFMRTRPANFPTIRIAQLAMFLYRYDSIFSLLLNQNLVTMHESLGLTQSTYWQEHYTFTKKSPRKIPGIGIQTIYTIMINSVVPLLAAYGSMRKEDFYLKKSIDILKSLPPEENHITKKWRSLGMPITSAFDSQGAIELYNQYCQEHQCLACYIGQSMLQKQAA